MIAINCPSSEDFVSYNGLRPYMASRSAPRRRTLSRTTDFDHAGPQDLPLVGGLCLIKTDFGRTKGARTTKTGRADEDKADGMNRRIKQAKGNKPFGIYLADGGRFLRRTLGRCYGGLCVSAIVERLDENVVTKDNDRLGGEIFRFTVEPRGRRYASASPRGSYLFD